jgi:hypothetical protein
MNTNVAEPWDKGMGYRAVGLVVILMVVVSFWVLLEKIIHSIVGRQNVSQPASRDLPVKGPVG